MVVERDPLRGEVDDDPRRDLLDFDLAGRDPRGHPVRTLRDLHQVLPWLAAGIEAGAADPEDRRHPVDVQLPEPGKGRSPGPAGDRGVRTDNGGIGELGRAEPLDRAGGARLGLRRWNDRRGLLFRAMTTASREKGEPDHRDGSCQPHLAEITAVKKVCRFRDVLPTTRMTAERLTTVRDTEMTLMRRHKHTAVTVHALRQRHGVPYHVERKVCSNCQRLLDEKFIKRAAA
jgi:hypothetical protein